LLITDIICCSTLALTTQFPDQLHDYRRYLHVVKAEGQQVTEKKLDKDTQPLLIADFWGRMSAHSVDS
jgi:hypothetical protein